MLDPTCSAPKCSWCGDDMAPLLLRFWKSRDGGPLVEFAIIIPFLVGVWIAIVALGTTFQRTQLLETAARDAARWLARVDDPDAGLAAASNIAVFGNPDGTGAARIPSLDAGDVTISFVDYENPVDPNTGQRTYAGPDPVRAVQVQINYAYDGAGLMGALGFPDFVYRASHEQRVIGD